MNPKLEGVIFSKAGNLAYRGYYWDEDIDSITGEVCESYGCDIVDGRYLYCLGEDGEGILDFAYEELVEFLEDLVMKGKGVPLPKGRLKIKKGYEMVEFELSPELTDLILDYVESGGKVNYVCEDKSIEEYY